MTARTLANMEMPGRVARLPRNEHGYPIPWFVATLDDGTRDFRIADAERQRDAQRFRLCWICGDKLGANATFTIGPMCAVNRISAEPPSHLDCATYAARVCPFLAVPQARRRTVGKPDDDGLIGVAGVALLRNPGVTLVWSTRSYATFRPDPAQHGVLWSLGDPTLLRWYAEGRPAGRAEILASMESGMPALRDACQHDDDPAASLVFLEGEYEKALTLVPEAES